MNAKRPLPTPVGELRPSQFMHTFGIGAIIDLPHISAMVMGLEEWGRDSCRTLSEERLLAEVKRRLGDQVERLASPPLFEEQRSFGPGAAGEISIGLPVAPFPRYLRCPFCKMLAPIQTGIFELRAPPGRPDRARYVHRGCRQAKEPTALPARFLYACENGHIDDFPWHEFVHNHKPCPGSMLYLEEIGATGEAADVQVRCTCGDRRRMADAFDDSTTYRLPKCKGRRPQLRDYDSVKCDALGARTILLGASNSWFSVSLSVLYVPPSAKDQLGRLVENHWDVLLAKVKSPAVLDYLREDGKLVAFADVDDDTLWAAIEARKKQGSSQQDDDLKGPEWQALAHIDSSRNGTDFQLEAVAPPDKYNQLISRVVLATRLREVTAMIGFTRIGSPRDFGGLDELPSNVRAPISRKPATMVPAVEVRGEGIFIQFDETQVAEYCDEHAAARDLLLGAHAEWRRRRRIPNERRNFPGLRYALLHSFSHALMRQLALECGYAAASLRERIYANPEDSAGETMAGVLLYTAAPDSEGTLGGLVRLGRPGELERHISRALEDMRLCSSDPLCADHEPEADGSLHGAACHACLFAPETSCERGNKYLDRSLLVQTVRGGRGFFDGGLG